MKFILLINEMSHGSAPSFKHHDNNGGWWLVAAPVIIMVAGGGSAPSFKAP